MPLLREAVYYLGEKDRPPVSNKNKFELIASVYPFPICGKYNSNIANIFRTLVNMYRRLLGFLKKNYIANLLLFLKFISKLFYNTISQYICEHQYMHMAFIIKSYISYPICFKSGNNFSSGIFQMFIQHVG